MVKVRDRIKVHEDGRFLEIVAVFDSGAGGSYLSDGVAEGIGYDMYPQPGRIPLRVKEKEAEVVGYVPAVDIEVAGYVLSEKETVGVQCMHALIAFLIYSLQFTLTRLISLFNSLGTLSVITLTLPITATTS